MSWLPIIIASDSISDTNYNFYLIDATNSDVTLTMIDATIGDGIYWGIKRIDNNPANTVTIAPGVAGQLINGLSSVTMAVGGARFILSCQGNWY
jgi:hypothetical protein